MLEDLNYRFSTAQPTSRLADAGILLHMFDQGEMSGVGFYARDGKLPDGAVQYGFSYDPWLPCPNGMWCHTTNDRLSASLINKHFLERAAANGNAGATNVLFTVGPGIVLNPALVETFCMFIGDGGTMAEADNHGCSARAWCDPTDVSGGRNDHQCPWRPSDLEAFMKAYTAKPFGYNEVVVDTAGWATKLPELIQAFVWFEGGPGGSGEGEAQARAVHNGFMKAHPDATTRLLKVNLKQLDAPFVEVPSGANDAVEVWVGVAPK